MFIKNFIIIIVSSFILLLFSITLDHIMVIQWFSLNGIGIFFIILFVILNEKLNKILEKLENIEKLSNENKFIEEDNDMKN